MGKKYTVINAEEIWRFYSKRIYSGGGNHTSPKLVRSNGLRPVDFDMRVDPATNQLTVYPDEKKGLSFSTTIERLARLGIEGVVWELAEPAKLPPELVINHNADDPEHPLLNVLHPMPASLFLRLLDDVAARMTKTGVKISGGKVVKL